LSAETFSGRLDLVYSARTRPELDSLLGDVAEPRLLRCVVLAGVKWLSSWSNEIRVAWRQPRNLRLVLPTRGEVLIGRSRSCDVVITDRAVSAEHAVLRYIDGYWTLRDNGSTNGTYVNGGGSLTGSWFGQGMSWSSAIPDSSSRPPLTLRWFPRIDAAKSSSADAIVELVADRLERV